jgi:hypothetical protein
MRECLATSTDSDGNAADQAHKVDSRRAGWDLKTEAEITLTGEQNGRPHKTSATCRLCQCHTGRAEAVAQGKERLGPSKTVHQQPTCGEVEALREFQEQTQRAAQHCHVISWSAENIGTRRPAMRGQY